MPKLTATQVKAISSPGRHSDGEGLYLTVSKTGAKSWVLMWKRSGKVREMGLGSATGVGRVGALTLADARQAAAAARRQIVAGLDPIAERKKGGASPTFGAVADELIEALAPGFRNAKHLNQWKMTLGDTYCGQLRRRAVDAISVADVLAVLQPIWLEKAETASRIRGRIEKVLDSAKARGLREGENPARWKGNLDHLLPKASKLARGHHAAMSYRDVPAFMATLRAAGGMGARALELVILTAARSGEVRGAKWSEIDLDAKTWTVPKERMKAGREHVVPLPDRAVDMLRALRKTASGDLIFPGTKGNPLSDMSIAAVVKRQKLNVTVHGFRSAFRDWAGNETGFPREIAEEALAHTVGNAVERAYRREAALEKRRKLMVAWAAYLAAPAGGNVRKLHRQAAAE
ncbi:integrase arm-type DNA-binding domain-containing protein [Aureimonas altamirensis]|uniref:tyrosine-type recombinase/integrase n=1 Tax=Aureimonas altamirensis TaxID=370622 RepID=UPI001E2B635F|nr:site-specific integrase [Aureimonas altamirensis]UHD44147.1 integrase arm-type DNA-binding domain-containing protein [Aureimonas altamirensis]